MQPLVIYGAGGHGREVAELVHDANAERAQWELLGFVSDDEASWGTTLEGLPVLGGRAWIERNAAVGVTLAIGSPAARLRVAESLRPLRVSHPVLRHPSARIGRTVAIGAGAQVTAGCVVTVNVRIGAHAILNRMCSVSHDCRLGDFATLAPGVQLGGAVHVGEGCDLGIGAAVIQGIHIGAWTVVGAGAAVTRELPAHCTAVGVPARVIKSRDPGGPQQR